jgi:DNA-binding LacI/PurR family transcriptional regulator
VRTLEEIAEATGVSTSTISRVLHGRDDVSSETREKVLGELRRANYSLSSKPSRRGRPSLRERKLKKIAILCRNHAEVRRNPFSAPILTAALEAGAPHGAEMLSVDWPDEQAAIPDQLQEADAAIALSFYLSRHIQTLGDRLPVVTIDTYCPGSGVDGVLPDYRGGTFEAVSALLATCDYSAFVGDSAAFSAASGSDLKSTVQFLNDGMRGFYATLAAGQSDADIRARSKTTRAKPQSTLEEIKAKAGLEPSFRALLESGK